MDYAERVKELCKAKGLLMKDVAHRLGITPTGLSKTLGQPYPQLQSLERIAKALDVELTELFVEPKDEYRCPHCGKVIHIEVKA